MWKLEPRFLRNLEVKDFHVHCSYVQKCKKLRPVLYQSERVTCTIFLCTEVYKLRPVLYQSERATCTIFLCTEVYKTKAGAVPIRKSYMYNIPMYRGV